MRGMSTLEIDVGDLRPSSVSFTATELAVTLADGRKIVWTGIRACAMRAARRAKITN
jgi:hypothetical protein